MSVALPTTVLFWQNASHCVQRQQRLELAGSSVEVCSPARVNPPQSARESLMESKKRRSENKKAETMQLLEVNWLTRMPTETWSIIFSFLDALELLKTVAHVCRAFEKACQSPWAFRVVRFPMYSSVRGAEELVTGWAPCWSSLASVCLTRSECVRLRSSSSRTFSFFCRQPSAH